MLTPANQQAPSQKPIVINNRPFVNNNQPIVVNNKPINVKYIKPPNRLIAPGVQGLTIPELSSEPLNPFVTNPINPDPNLRLSSPNLSFNQAPGNPSSQIPSPPTSTINSLINQNNQINQNNPSPTPAPQEITGEFLFS